jgi:DNA modification methylase
VDPFSGSASTMIACEQTDRTSFAIEIEERFVDVGVKRFIEYVGSDEDVYLIREGRKIQYKDLEVG